MDNEITEALHGIMHMRNPLAPCVIKGVNKEKQFFFLSQRFHACTALTGQLFFLAEPLLSDHTGQGRTGSTP
jgi:hypothetical protein